MSAPLPRMKPRSARWIRSRVSINIGFLDEPHGWRRIPSDGYCCAAAPGLAVTRSYSVSGRWAITHIASGFKMPVIFRSLDDARKVALLLAELADWRAAWAELRDDCELKYAAVAILEPFR